MNKSIFQGKIQFTHPPSGVFDVVITDQSEDIKIASVSVDKVHVDLGTEKGTHQIIWDSWQNCEVEMIRLRRPDGRTLELRKTPDQ